MLKRVHKGAFHKLFLKYLDRYAQDFAGRHNMHDDDTINIKGLVAAGMCGKQLGCRESITDNGLPKGARS